MKNLNELELCEEDIDIVARFIVALENGDVKSEKREKELKTHARCLHIQANCASTAESGGFVLFRGVRNGEEVCRAAFANSSASCHIREVFGE